MKKFLRYKYNVVFALLALAISGCTDYEQDYPDANKPIITPETAVTINEGETGFITLNLSRAIGSAIDLKLMVVESTAEDADYSVESAGEYTSPDDGVGPVPAYHIVIPTGVTSFDIPISVFEDLDIEGDESVTFQITSTGNGLAFIPEESQMVTVTMVNTESEDFVVKLSWDGNYTDAAGVEHAFCDFDLDLEIYLADLSDVVATSYGDCPEQITLSPGDLEDGTYYIVPSFYTNAGTAPAENVQIPAELTFAQPGAQVETIDLSNVWDYESGGYVEENEDAYFMEYVLTVSGNSFIVKDSEGNVVFEQ